MLRFQAAESGIVKIKTIAARNTEILAGERTRVGGRERGRDTGDQAVVILLR